MNAFDERHLHDMRVCAFQNLAFGLEINIDLLGSF